LGHLSLADQQQFIAHLKAGRLRMAISMVVDGAVRYGIREASALFASGRVKNVRGSDGKVHVQFQPPRVPPDTMVVVCYAKAAQVQRAELARVLQRGGVIQLWNMPCPVTLPPLSKRDTDKILTRWPHRSRRGRPRAGRQ
jgi:hypothetical protein